ncbi:transposase domain-containing protein [Streptomyces glaucus]|uniref:Transposase IS4 N-terminal domain-containing protein n=1 Tax=Streptomyces glaucus TaxID=284029 RepID=A0ABN3J9I7_9ACTN
MAAKPVIPHEVVAPGPYAPGHLGELTRIIPFEMVDEVLAETNGTQQRVPDLPSRVVVYLLLAGALFPDMGWPQVWKRLTAGLGGAATAAPTAGALAQARKRVGDAPLRRLFDLLRGPAAGIRTPGTRWRGLLVCAIDGTLMAVPDSRANRTEFVKHHCNNGGAGYPSLRLLVLVACGTRTVLDAVFGSTTEGETSYAPRLFRIRWRGGLEAGGFGGGFLAGDVVDVATAAHGPGDGRPDATPHGGLIAALAGALAPAPLAHRPPRFPLSGTAPLLLRVGAGGLVAVEVLAVGVVELVGRGLFVRAPQAPPYRRVRAVLLELFQMVKTTGTAWLVGWLAGWLHSFQGTAIVDRFWSQLSISWLASVEEK